MSFDAEILSAIKAQYLLLREKRQLSTAEYDYEIEEADWRGSEDAAWSRKVLYILKYGRAPARYDDV